MTRNYFMRTVTEPDLQQKVISCEEAKDGYNVVLDQTGILRKAAVSMQIQEFWEP